MKDFEPKRIGRIGATAIFSIAALLPVGCSPETQPKPVASTKPAAAATLSVPPETPRLPSTPLSPEQIDRLVSDLYPQLKGKIPNESGTFSNSKGEPVRWLNYTQSHFDERVAESMFSFSEKYAPLGDFPVIDDRNGKLENVSVERRPSSREEILFIVPATVSLPTGTGYEKGAVLETRPEREVKAVFVRPSSLQSEESIAYIFATEACEQARYVRSSDPGIDRVFLIKVCTSLAEAWSAKQKGLDYFTYTKSIANETNDYGQTFFPAPEEVYKAIPKIGNPLKK